MKTLTARRIAGDTVKVILAVVYLLPVVVMLYNGFKPYSEIMTDLLALPQVWTLDNFTTVWTEMDVPRLFLNNVLATAIGVAGIVVVGALAGYRLSRTKSRASWFLYLLLILPMLIPFQATMISVLKLAQSVGLSGSILGLGVQYWGFGAPMAIFLYHGFVKSIPVELDEAALIDGANPAQSFVQVIFPLMSPMTFTVLVVDVMWIWNDYLLPLIMVNSQAETRTLTLAVYAYFGQYVSNYGYAIAALVIAVVPSVVLFLLLQKHVVKGVAAGAVKG